MRLNPLTEAVSLCVLPLNKHVGELKMADKKRNFALRESTGDEPSTFSGHTPRQAALKAARRLDPAPAEQQAEHEELVLREKGTEKVHIYEGWAWEDDAPDDKPEWMPDRITEANVSKQGIDHLDDL
jgi:hypothetical protein